MDEMEQFKTPNEYIIAEISANRGTQNLMQKEELFALADKLEIQYEKMNIGKKELVTLVAEKYGYKELAELAHVGVPSVAYQKKFGITNKEVKLLAKQGIIRITGERRFHKFGKELSAPTYSVYDYFRLTREEVTSTLLALPKHRGESNKE